MTTDTLYLLIHKIKGAWHIGKVAAVLFLNIKRAFLNIVPARLIHNLRKCGLPCKYIDFVDSMLHNRVTTLKFNSYISGSIEINNRIGQGDPLSMVIYQFYNADLVDIPSGKSENTLAYINNTILLTTVDTFNGVHKKLYSMMTRQRGVSDWSKVHNSLLIYSKLVLIDFMHRSNHKERATL